MIITRTRTIALSLAVAALRAQNGGAYRDGAVFTDRGGNTVACLTPRLDGGD